MPSARALADQLWNGDILNHAALASAEGKRDLAGRE